MSKLCPTCKTCMTCGDSTPNHDCPYPNCDKYHRCPTKAPGPRVGNRKRVTKLAKSARESEAEASDRDMETGSKPLNDSDLPDATVEETEKVE